VTGGRRRLHNEELHNLHASPNSIKVIQSSKIRWTEHVARLEKINASKILVTELEGKRSLARLRRRWEDNVRMDLREVGWEDVSWMHLAQGRDY